MPDDDDSGDLEVYIYRGRGEKVPETVEKLIVIGDVEELPERLCYDYQRLRQVVLSKGLTKIGSWAFAICKNLLEINVPSTVTYIGQGAYGDCEHLATINFESSDESSPHKLWFLDEESFISCYSLRTIKLPPSMSLLAERSFQHCEFLVEANLSQTRIHFIRDNAFQYCASLLTVSLPWTLERIMDDVFAYCSELVTVVMPIEMDHSIMIGISSFNGCRRLANLELPRYSSCWSNTFTGCDVLHERYGTTDDHSIRRHLESRFAGFPVHMNCYENICSPVGVEEFRQCIADQKENGYLVDKFGMTPFHVLFSTVEPREELLDILLELLPNEILSYKDANDRRPLDYLIRNWRYGAKTLFHKTLQKSMMDPLSRWGAASWKEKVQSMAEGILLSQDDLQRRENLLMELYSFFTPLRKIESTSVLEMALWKGKIKLGGRKGDGSKRQALDREECRLLNGSNVVIPNVLKFLDLSGASPELFPPEEPEGIEV